MGKYGVLLNILEGLRKEAPPEQKRYQVSRDKHELYTAALSKLFIHLFLKVQYGLTDFQERERFVTDGPYDGGIDGYYIDETRRYITLIQSKFRASQKNFEEKAISFDELLAMDAARILDGEERDERGNEYSGKIKALQRHVSHLPDVARYRSEVIIMANLKVKEPEKLKRLTGFDTTLFNHKRIYKELVFPVVCGTYYNAEDLVISIDLSRTSSSSRINYDVSTEKTDCEISVYFVPTVEIAKCLYKYRNSILKFNPRSYLGLQSNPVNRQISKTIIDQKSNEFALYNNGITMLSHGTEYNEKTGAKGRAQVLITRPQIINGGQTAYTLCRLFEQHLAGELPLEVFDGKEVLLRVIAFGNVDALDTPEHLQLIEAISKATNLQSPVDEADRRSNDKVQVELQRKLFDRYGYFYERKRGEYDDGVRDGYVDRSRIIGREDFLRVALACDGKPGAARSRGANEIFQETEFRRILPDTERCDEFYFGYLCWELVPAEAEALGRERTGHARNHGRHSVVTACMQKWELGADVGEARSIVSSIVARWREFEDFFASESHNQRFFRTRYDLVNKVEYREMNYPSYYKNPRIAADIRAFFQQ